MEDFAGAEIRPKKTWRLIGNFVVVAIWCALLSAAIRGYENRQALHRSDGQAVGILLFSAAILLWMVYITVKALFYVETVSVTSSTLSIVGRLFGFQLSDKTYDNSTVRNLRYEEWSGGRNGTQNGIRFEYNGETVTFARQADTSLSWDLIDRMCGAFAFSTPEPATPAGVVKW